MAIAAEALEAGEAGGGAAAEGASNSRGEGAGFRALSQGSGQLRRAGPAVRGAAGAVSSPSATAQTITKLVWAIALGLIALQVAAEATGQQWSFSLPGRGPKPVKGAYLPLYPGQVAAAMPGVLPAPQLTAGAAFGALPTP